MRTRELTIKRLITKEEEGTYFLLPFSVPEGVERLDVRYEYMRHEAGRAGEWETRQEVNIIDLALCGTGERYIGASGSDRRHIYVSARESAQGYAPTAVEAGEWYIVVGAYHVQPQGVPVTYTVTFTMKERRLIRGDTHMHTRGSDGHLTVIEIAEMAKENGLDYIFVTDHNNYAHNMVSCPVSGITVLPGTEWTHYRGHMGMLGVKKPYESAFPVNTPEEAHAKILEARANGAFLVLNHPCCPNNGWRWGYDMPYDAVEVWNGGTPTPVNDAAIRWWHTQLCAGRRLPITGGSDFHYTECERMVGSPTTCLYADSTEPDDILAALAAGRSFLIWQPHGPTVSAEAGDAILGGEAPRGTPLRVRFEGLAAGDMLYFITDRGERTVAVPAGAAGYETTLDTSDALFYRFEVRGKTNTSLIETRKLLSSPIYFTKE